MRDLVYKYCLRAAHVLPRGVALGTHKTECHPSPLIGSCWSINFCMWNSSQPEAGPFQRTWVSMQVDGTALFRVQLGRRSPDRKEISELHRQLPQSQQLKNHPHKRMQGVLTVGFWVFRGKVCCWKGLATHMHVGKRKDYRSKAQVSCWSGRRWSNLGIEGKPLKQERKICCIMALRTHFFLLFIQLDISSSEILWRLLERSDRKGKRLWILQKTRICTGSLIC